MLHDPVDELLIVDSLLTHDILTATGACEADRSLLARRGSYMTQTADLHLVYAGLTRDVGVVAHVGSNRVGGYLGKESFTHT